MNAVNIERPMANTPAGDGADECRYQRFTTRLLFSDLRFTKDSVGPGDSLPPFELQTTGGDRLTNADVFGGSPVLFLFGAMNCPHSSSAD